MRSTVVFFSQQRTMSATANAPFTRLHPSIHHPTLRHYQLLPTTLNKTSLMYPIFLHPVPTTFSPVPAFPDQYHIGIDRLVDFLKPLVEKGLAAVLLFGMPGDGEEKDEVGSCAGTESSVVMRATRLLRKAFPSLLVSCDVCLCAYTSHGHCGILDEEGNVDNAKSIARIAEVAVSYARAGCQLVAPSDMMDNRIHAIKAALEAANLSGQCAVMSYAAKYASALYGPFRAAAGSKPAFGDRKCYQLPPGARGLGRRALVRDAREGADIVMVKPGIAYLDLVRDARELCPDLPVAIYHVSGEYAQLYYAAQAGVFDLKDIVLETMQGAMRAGANILITYFTPQLLDWLDQ